MPLFWWCKRMLQQDFKCLHFAGTKFRELQVYRCVRQHAGSLLRARQTIRCTCASRCHMKSFVLRIPKHSADELASLDCFWFYERTMVADMWFPVISNKCKLLQTNIILWLGASSWIMGWENGQHACALKIQSTLVKCRACGSWDATKCLLSSVLRASFDWQLLLSVISTGRSYLSSTLINSRNVGPSAWESFYAYNCEWLTLTLRWLPRKEPSVQQRPGATNKCKKCQTEVKEE